MGTRRPVPMRELVDHFAALSEAIAKEDRLEAILQAYNEHLSAIFPFDRASISVIQGDQQISWHLVRGRPQAEIERTSSPRRGSLVDQVIHRNQPVIIADLRLADQEDPEVQEIMRLGARSSIIYPLKVGEHVVGAMDLEHNEAGAYSEADLPMVRLVANQIALALEKGQVLRRQEQRIEEVGEQLVRAGKMATVGQLAAVLAHELKNRFNVIQLGVQSLAAILPQQDTQVRLLLHSVQRAIGRGQDLMQELLRYARPQEPVRERVNFKTLADDILLLVKRADVKIEVHWEEPVPPVFGSEAQLGQVLVNLIMNALDAMPEGGTLTLAGTWEKDELVVTLRDTGIGMSKEVQDHLFEPFFTTKKHGTGLGLPVSRTIMDQVGGELAISSEMGKGTVVTLRFPVAETGRLAA